MEFKYFILFAVFAAASAQRNAICRLPPDEGVCRASIPRFYFNPAAGNCSFFIYGGCEGNENNFQTIEECEETCGEPKRVSDFEGADFETGCEPKPQRGFCKGFLDRWFFNVTSGQCEMFLYSGCGGNDNNYESEEECEFACRR